MHHLSKFLLAIVIMMSVLNAKAQNEQYAFKVNFKNKAGTTYSLSNPQEYLSSRALTRRTKFNVSIDSTDLPVVQTYIDSILHLTNGVLHLTSKWQNFAVILVEDSTSILSLSTLDFVSNFKKVGYYASGLHMMPAPQIDSNATGGKPTNYDENYYGAAWNQIHICNGEYLHSANWKGNNELIAVIDVGFNGINSNEAFDSLLMEGRLMDTHNFVIDTSYVFDYSDHGTRVLSSMASLIPETHVGTAPYASYALYLTDDENTEQVIEESNFVAAAERADSIGADLISTSVGYNTFQNPDDSHTYADLDGHTTIIAKAANTATAKGIVVVASAGNEGSNSWNYILTPGDADSAMTIGSVNASEVYTNSSGKGPNASNRLKPDVCGMGFSAALVSPNGGIEFRTGTSYATPIIAGLTACLMQSSPEMTPYQIRTLIASISDSFSTPNYRIGNGVPDFKKALEQATSIPKLAENEPAFKLFPNPANDYIVIEGEGTLQFSICDIQGRTLKSGHTTSGKTIALSGLEKGFYLLSINNDNYSQVKKIIVR